VVAFRSWDWLAVEVEVETTRWRVEVVDEEEYAWIFYG
jgi:hypothetical protein